LAATQVEIENGLRTCRSNPDLVWARCCSSARGAASISTSLRSLDDAFVLLVDEAGRASIRAMRGNFLIGFPLRVKMRRTHREQM